MTADALNRLPVGTVIAGEWKDGTLFAAIKEKPDPRLWPERSCWLVSGDSQNWTTRDLVTEGKFIRVVA